MISAAEDRPHGGALLAVAAAAILFGTTGTAQALGPDSTTALGVGAVRVAIGAVGLLVLSARAAVSDVARPTTSRTTLIAGGLGVAGYQVGFFVGTERAGVALGTIVALGSGPFFAGVYETCRTRQRPSGIWLGATVLAGIGMACVAVARSSPTTSISMSGVFAALGAGLSYTVFSVSTKSAIEGGVPSTQVMANAFSIGAAMMCPFLLTEPMSWLITGRGVIVALHLGIAATAVAYALFGFGLSSLSVPTVVTVTLAEPATAAILSVVVLHQPLSLFGWTGVALVLCGVALVGLRAR